MLATEYVRGKAAESFLNDLIDSAKEFIKNRIGENLFDSEINALMHGVCTYL